jgi:hypothetical protein
MRFIEFFLVLIGSGQIIKLLYRFWKHYKLTMNEEHTEFISQLRKMLLNKSDTFKVKVVEKNNIIHLTILADPSYLIEVDKVGRTFKSMILTTGPIHFRQFIWGIDLSDNDYKDILDIIEDYKERDRLESEEDNKKLIKK